MDTRLFVSAGREEKENMRNKIVCKKQWKWNDKRKGVINFFFF